MAVCMFVYGTRLSSFIMRDVRICAVIGNNLYVVVVSVSSLLLLLLLLLLCKAYSHEIILFEENETTRARRNGNACLKQMDKWAHERERRRKRKIDKRRSDRSTTWQTLFRYWSWVTSPWHYYHYHQADDHYHHHHRRRRSRQLGTSRTWNKRGTDICEKKTIEIKWIDAWKSSGIWFHTSLTVKYFQDGHKSPRNTLIHTPCIRSLLCNLNDVTGQQKPTGRSSMEFVIPSVHSSVTRTARHRQFVPFGKIIGQAVRSLFHQCRRGIGEILLC